MKPSFIKYTRIEHYFTIYFNLTIFIENLKAFNLINRAAAYSLIFTAAMLVAWKKSAVLVMSVTALRRYSPTLNTTNEGVKGSRLYY